MKSQLTDQTTLFISALAALHPPPDSIWLIGSRANGRATQESDTDLIVIGSTDFLSAVRSQIQQPRAIDCLVVCNGDDYQDPWQNKSGSLSKLKWMPVDANSAKYIGTKWVPDEESSNRFETNVGDFVHREESAIRIWP